MNTAVANKRLEALLKETFAFVEDVQSIKNCEGLRNEVIAIVSPMDVSECLRLVEIANEYSCSLYPVSTGKNWGFGGSVPSSDNCILVNLSKMNQISDYNDEFASLKIQPGVTQKQLYSFLKERKSSFRMDVTGSGEDTSVLGNALERGLGYQALRHEHILSMKVLLMDGTILDTGYSRFSNSSLEKCLSYGLGPSLNHLFTQSNFALVLEATFKLIKKCDYECAFSFSVNNEKELQAMSLLIQDFFDNAVITGIPKVFDKRRCEITFCPKYFTYAQEQGLSITREEVVEKFNKSWGDKAWTFVTSLAGPRDIVEAKLKYIEKKLEGLSSLKVIDRETLAKRVESTFEGQLTQHFDSLLLGYLQGVPSNDALMSNYWDNADYDSTPHLPEDKEYAFIYITPLLPNSGAEISSFLSVYKEVCERFSFNPAMTLNYLNRNSIEAVITLTFKKNNPFMVQRAHNFKTSLLRSLAEQGQWPYRLDVASMQNFFSATEPVEDPWAKTCLKIKAALDPNNILSPKRYLGK